MVERTTRRNRRDAGFTLAEMLVALSILAIGVTTLLAALSDSLSLRRTTDARLVAQEAVDDFLHRLAQGGLKLRDGADSPFDVELAAPAPQPLDGAPGMSAACTLEFDENRPDVALARVRITWLEGGETVAEEFLRVLPRQLPLSARIRAFRSEHVRPR